MEVHVIASTVEGFKVRFSDTGSGLNFVIGITIPLLNQWRLFTNQLMPTVTTLADELLMNHDQTKPLKPEYLFSPGTAGRTMDETVDMLRDGRIS